MLLLVGQVFVGIARLIEGRLLLVALGAPHVGRAEDGLGVGGCRLLADERVAQSEGSVREGTVGALHPALEKVLLMGIPRCRDVPRRQPAALAALAELVGAVVTGSEVSRVASLVAIVGIGEVSQSTVVGASERRQDGTFFLGLLIELRGDDLQASLVVEHTIGGMFRCVIVGAVGLHTSQSAEDMGLLTLDAPDVVEVSREAEVELFHLVAVQDIDTALRHDRDRPLTGFVGVGVEVGVRIHDIRVVHTGTIGLSHVRLVKDDMLAV